MKDILMTSRSNINAPIDNKKTVQELQQQILILEKIIASERALPGIYVRHKPELGLSSNERSLIMWKRKILSKIPIKNIVYKLIKVIINKVRKLASQRFQSI